MLRTGFVLSLGLYAAGAWAAVALAQADPEKAVERTAANRPVSVTIYPNSALVAREVDVPEGPGRIELIVPALPARTVPGSLYSEGAEGIRVLQTRFRTRQVQQDTRADVRAVEDELKTIESARQKLVSELAAAGDNLKLLAKLENFTAVTTVSATEKGALNSDSAIALANFIMENRTKRHEGFAALEKQLQQNQQQAEFARRKLAELAGGSARTEYDAVVAVEKTAAGAGKIRLNYLTDTVAWRPQYKFRAGAVGEPVRVEYQAALVQQSGENWDGVRVTLSTAQPALHAAPPELDTLTVMVQHPGSPSLSALDLLTQSRSLRTQAVREFGRKNPLGVARLSNTAAALDQCWELLHPNPADAHVACSAASREGPAAAYALAQRFSIPTRADEQVVEIARLELSPEYYHKASPVLTPHVYRLADLTNKSDYLLLPGEASMYLGSDFVGQTTLPLVAVGQTFTVGFGVDPQIQVDRQLINKTRNIQGGNQVLAFEYRFLVSSLRTQRTRLQLWDRLPLAEGENVGINLARTSPALSTDPIYVREARPKNLLRWDLSVEPGLTGERAMPVSYEFKLEMDRQLTLGAFQSGVVQADPRRTEDPKVQAALAKLSPEDRALAEAQVFCAIKEESRLGSVGSIHKVMVKDRPVFVCCQGCAQRAQSNPDDTLARVNRLMAQVRSGAR